MVEGERHRFERDLFDGAYDSVQPSSGEHPVYGSIDLLFDDHGAHGVSDRATWSLRLTFGRGQRCASATVT